MKKKLKILSAIFVLLVVLSYCIPKGGIDWNAFDEKHKYVNDGFRFYEIVVDFSKPSCEDRLFVYNVSEEAELVYSGVVLHGCGGNSTPSKPEFSNEVGSNCSSLGEFTLEGIVRMRNGMEAIKLKGWSDTNSNAEQRGIFIHPSLMATLLPFNLPGMNFPLTKASEGCFAVSYHTYHFIKKCMETNNNIDCKTTLFSIYDN